ncbi:hypothetical protein [Phyllobacterium sp. LjRoot231]
MRLSSGKTKRWKANSVKGKAALQLSRELGVQYKTAWVLSLKIKEALG